MPLLSAIHSFRLQKLKIEIQTLQAPAWGSWVLSPRWPAVTLDSRSDLPHLWVPHGPEEHLPQEGGWHYVQGLKFFDKLFSFSLKLAKTESSESQSPKPWHSMKSVANTPTWSGQQKLVISGHRHLLVSLPLRFSIRSLWALDFCPVRLTKPVV